MLFDKNIIVEWPGNLERDACRAIEKLPGVFRCQIVKERRLIFWCGFRRVVARSSKRINVVERERGILESVLIGDEIFPKPLQLLLRPASTELLKWLAHRREIAQANARLRV